MAVTIRNILVGAGRLWIADAGAANPTWNVAGGVDSLNDDFDAAADWSEVGATQEGVEIGYAPDYGEVEVDQLKDAAVMFNQGVEVTMNTNLAEATLQNLVVAWGLSDAALTVNEDNNTFSIGVPDDEPVERRAAVVGRAPRTAAGVARERVYLANRVISIDGSTHALRRTEATVFPVSFRLLPDPAQAKGQEYGQILDRIPGDDGVAGV